MKIAILSTEDIKPGAFRAAYRLHKSLIEIGLDSRMFVQGKYSDDPSVSGLQLQYSKGKIINALRPSIDRLPLKFYTKRENKTYSLQWTPDNLYNEILKFAPDVVSLQWICKGYLKIETLLKINQLNIPIVWTLRDMWPFTGGCHYTYHCQKYINSCGNCPQLNSNSPYDLSNWVWRRKNKVYQNSDITIVALSNWIGNCARASSLFKDKRIEVIPNGINTEIYKPINQEIARNITNLPINKKLVLFSAVRATGDPRKGFSYLKFALEKMSKMEFQSEIELVIIGATKPISPETFGYKTHYLGNLNDDFSIALAYNVADVFIAPSIQENLPNTVLEALACGIPCVAFNIGGMPDLIEHQKNGYLAKPYQVDDLVQGLVWVLENEERRLKLSNYARNKVETEFNLMLQAKRYKFLFENLK